MTAPSSPSPAAPLTVEQQQALTRAALEQTYSIAFEQFVEQVSNGRVLGELIAEYHTPLDPARFRVWIYADEKRKRAWLTAKAISAEVMEEELVRIADAQTTSGELAMPEDVQRSRLKIETRLKIMAFNNRKRYGDIKHIKQETTTHIDTSGMDRDQLRSKILAKLGLGVDTSLVMEGEYVDEGGNDVF